MTYLTGKQSFQSFCLAGYDYAISIEHEDGLMSQNEGLTKTIEALKEVLMFENIGEMYWA